MDGPIQVGMMPTTDAFPRAMIRRRRMVSCFTRVAIDRGNLRHWQRVHLHLIFEIITNHGTTRAF